jgi:NADPH:quinone reductase-like Zn-dependent oxidoreductase
LPISNPLTAVILTGDELNVRPGEWLLRTAAGSIVGQSVIQLGIHVGFKTLNVVRRRSAVEDILALGGTAVICTEDEDLRERVADIAGNDGVSKAIDCVSGQVGADLSRALAPHGELIVYGALSTHRQTDPDKLTIPIFAHSLIYETKTVRGFWLSRWFTETAKDRMAATIDRTIQLADSGALRVPEGQPIPSKGSATQSISLERPNTEANRCWYSNRSRPVCRNSILGSVVWRTAPRSC